MSAGSVIIIDNDQVNSFVLRNIIARNYPQTKVEVFGDGLQALEYLQQVDESGEKSLFPGVILLDIYMPVMDGFQFLKEYSQRYAHKQSLIFAMSNSLVKEDQQRANQFQVVKGYITKPLIYNNIEFIMQTYQKIFESGES